MLGKLLFRDKWYLAVRKKPTGPASYQTTDRYHPILPPRDRYYADPFLFQHARRTYLFFEDFPYARARGHISCMILDAEGRPGPPEVVLERPYHLSYPVVFAWQGDIWMIPETSSNHTIELYRCHRFPDDWQRETVLMRDVQASDTTIAFHHGRIWLFTNLDTTRRYTADQLCLFSARTLLGPWEPHPQNPVVTGAAHARPAGQIFVDNGMLIRPAQDCQPRYGYAVQFNRIDAWTAEAYQESPLWKTLPAMLENSDGTHTYNCNEDFEVRDAYRITLDLYSKWLAVLARTRRYIPADRRTP